MSEINSRCFVIMPFSKSSEEHTEKYWTKHFNELLKPTIEELGVKAYRVEAIREDIINKIITNLITSPIVLADLTDHNPNVFWELGVRQSFKHNTITIAEKGTPIPFDISAKATIFYNVNNKEELTQFNVKLKAAIEDCRNNPEKTDSHVLESISGRGSLYEVMKLEETRRHVESLILEAQLNLQEYEIDKTLLSDLEDFSNIPFNVRFSVWNTKSLEFLLLHRYLDEPDSFYKTAEFIMQNLNGMKVRCPWLNSLTEDDKKRALIYFIGISGKNLYKAFQIWLAKLERIYQTIINKLQTMINEASLKPLEELRSVFHKVDPDYYRFDWAL